MISVLFACYSFKDLESPGWCQSIPSGCWSLSALQQQQSLATAPWAAPAGLTLLRYICPVPKPQILLSIFDVIHALYGACLVEGEAGLHPKVYEHQMQLQRWRIYSSLLFLKHYLLCISPHYQRFKKRQTTLKSIYTEYCCCKNNFLNVSEVLWQTKEATF